MNLQLTLVRFALLTVEQLCVLQGNAEKRQPIWPTGKMPDAQSHQIAAMWNEVNEEGFGADKYRMAILSGMKIPILLWQTVHVLYSYLVGQ